MQHRSKTIGFDFSINDFQAEMGQRRMTPFGIVFSRFKLGAGLPETCKKSFQFAYPSKDFFKRRNYDEFMIRKKKKRRR